MTGKRLAVIAAILVLLTVTGLAVQPLLATRQSTTTPAPALAPSVPAVIGSLADTAATDALRCPPRHGHQAQAEARWCGRLTVARQQAECLDGQTCQVDLLGTLITATTRIPIALTVTLRLRPTGWRAVVVSS